MMQIGALMAGGFGSLVAFASGSVVKKVLVAAAATAAIYYFVSQLSDKIDTELAKLGTVIPNDILIAASWVIPDNWSTCLAVIAAAHLAMWLFRMALFGLLIKVASN